MPRDVSTPGWEHSTRSQGRMARLSLFTRRSADLGVTQYHRTIQHGGPDVYEGTGAVDWNAVKRAGHDVGICKALEGTGHIDSRLGRNVRAIRRAGLVLGIYNFVHPGEHSPLASARAFSRVAHAVHLRPDEIPILDLELREGHTDVKLQAWADDYFGALHRELPKHDMWEYTSAEFREFAARPHRRYWVAAYPNLPMIRNIPRSQIVMHQFTDTAHVPGIKGGADLSKVVSG